MSFDPFGDFETRGYLRNLASEKDPKIVKQLEHDSFETGIDDAFAWLGQRDTITYDDFLAVHRILFEAIYPWAGQDRLITAPHLAIHRGPVLFARPDDIRRSVEYGLNIAQRVGGMSAAPGEVMGYFAHGHPFLDGNGRTMMVIHTALAERAGMSIDWARTDKDRYLAALTMELDAPGAGHLDAYLDPFRREAIGSQRLVDHLHKVDGLDTRPSAREDAVLGRVDDEQIRARYEQQELRQREAHDRIIEEIDRDRNGRSR